ncbi:hypothetical protein BZG36_04175 [Bifiguratus adelaidae]|uniref:Amidohydrolase-related domain-containing protein n=1 Tax=Bifiguratus adelaidae TaxID=1938954 RepID=A0A261XYY4_9FUNG|nr:hypothetical protein BZG36_04175 [Bifiguratus adelaidae]
MEHKTLTDLLPFPAVQCCCVSQSSDKCEADHGLYDPFRIERPVIDAHTHIFPPPLMNAVWRFFEQHYWPVVYKQTYEHSQVDILIDRGVHHVVLLQYAHKNGIARGLNEYMHKTVERMNAKYGRSVATGLATVMPGEPDAEPILVEAFEKYGLAGVKLHSHVQVIQPNDPRMDPIYRVCTRYKKPVLIHAGREPNSRAHKKDAKDLCHVDFVRDVLDRFPDLVLCIPHLGFNETTEYMNLLRQYPNLYLDTTMQLGRVWPAIQGSTTDDEFEVLFREFADRILYGTDFPQLPNAWYSEYRNLAVRNLWKVSEENLDKILYKNAIRLYGIDLGEKEPRRDIVSTL